MAKKITKGESYFGKVFIMALMWACYFGVVGPALISTPDTVLVIIGGVIGLLLAGVTYVTFFRKEEESCDDCYDPRCRTGCAGSNRQPPTNPPSCGTGGCC